MWPQGNFQQWQNPTQQNSQVDWAALAQAWMQNKDTNQNNVQQQNNPPIPNNGPHPPNAPFANQSVPWQQQQSWPNQQQWNHSNWSNLPPTGGGFAHPPQWPGGEETEQAPPIAPPGEDSKPLPPLPPLPPDENKEDTDAPLEASKNTDDSAVKTNEQPFPNEHSNQFQNSPARLTSQNDEKSISFDAPPQNYPVPPPMDASAHPRPDGPWNNEWKPPPHPHQLGGGWGGPRGTPPPVNQWEGGNMPSWFGNGAMNQFAQGHGMMNDNMAQGMDQAKRKVLPAWIREGLERMEQEKQKKTEKEEINVPSKPPVQRRKSSGSESLTKSKFDSGSEPESDAELPQEEPDAAEPEVTEEEKNALMIVKMRKMLTEILLDVTNLEIKEIAQSIYKKATKAPAKQLAQSSALSSIGQLGVVEGYSSDEGSVDLDDNKEVDGNSSSSVDEDEIERKVEAFNKKQTVRNINLEASEMEARETAAQNHGSNLPQSPSKRSSSALGSNTKERVQIQSTAQSDEDIKPHLPDPVEVNKNEPLNDNKSPDHSSSKTKSKKKTQKMESDSSSMDDTLPRHSNSSSTKHKSRETPSPKRDKKSTLLKKSRDKSRSRSRERKHSSRDVKSSHSHKSSSSHHKRKRSTSRSPRSSRKHERKQSKSYHSPDRKKSSSHRRDSRERSYKRHSDYDSDDNRKVAKVSRYSRHDSESKSYKKRRRDSSDSDVSDSYKKKSSSSRSKKKKKKQRRKRSSSEDSSPSSSTSSDEGSSSSQTKSRKNDKYDKSSKADKYSKSHSKRKSKH